jgi:hypothetical protein
MTNTPPIQLKNTVNSGAVTDVTDVTPSGTLRGHAHGGMGIPPDCKQSRVMSLNEAITNVIVGFVLALLTQIALFPLFGLVVSAADNVLIGIIFTAVSIVRSFTLRRVFEAVRVRQAKA